MQHTKTLVAAAAALLLTLVASPSAAETLTVSWDMSPEAEVTGYFVHIGSESGVYTQRVNVGNTTTYVLTNAAAGQRYCFAVSAYFAGLVEGSRSPEACTAGNLAPTLANPGDQTHPLGTALSLTLGATDPEGGQLTFSASGLPPGLSIAAATGVISGSPTQAGPFPVTASVSDGPSSVSVSFAWTITSSVPAAPNLRTPSGPTSSTTPTFEWDPVATATRYRLWVDDNSSTNPRVQIDLTPAQAGCAAAGSVCRSNPAVVLAAGPASWSVRASNSFGDGPWSGARDFSIADGRAPTVTIAAPTAADTHSTGAASLAIGGTATDDVGVVQVTWSNDRGGAGSATGTSTWTVASVPLRAGANVITVTARDAENNTSIDRLTITRTDGQSPTVEITLPTSAATHRTTGMTITFGGTAADEFGVVDVRWSSNRGSSGVANGTTSWGVPEVALQRGQNVITVTARDAAGNSATDSLTVDVADGEAPTVAIVSPTAAASYTTAAATLTLSGTASDAFGVTQVSWANSRGGSGTAAGTTGWTVVGIGLQTGDNVITVTARDAAGQTATDSITVTRTDAEAPTVAITVPTANPAHSVTTRTIALGGTARDATGIAQVSWASDRGASGVASGTTTWSVASVALQPGANVITVTARDVAGNGGLATLTVTLTDGVGPDVRFAAPTSAASFASSSPTLSIAGSATDDSGVARVAWTNDRGGSGATTGTTSWSAAAVALRPGTNQITVTATDSVGNTGSARLSVTATDTTRPTVAVVSPAPSTRYLTGAATVAVSGTAADDFGLATVSWTNDRGGSGVASGTTSWSVASVALQPGTNVITVTATDQAGNTATDALRVISDNRRPTVSITQPVSTATHTANTATVNLAGSAADDLGVTEVSWSSNRGRRGVATGTTSWGAAGVALDAGSNVLTVTARDEVGNTTSAVLTVVLDNGRPSVAIESPTANPTTATNVASLGLRGTANDDVGVTQVTWTNDRGGSGTATGATSWAIANVALQAGVNVLTVTARDAAGNSSTDTLTVHFDTRAPVVSIAAPTAAATFATTAAGVALAGVATDDGAVAEVRWANNRGGNGVAIGTTRWSVERAALQLGANEITITARDAAGNSATARLLVTASDRQAPVVRITGPTLSDTFSTSDRVINLNGTATDDFGVTQVAWASDRGTSGVARGTGSWIAGGVALQPGLNVIAVTALDAAGNTSSDVIRITLDGQLPVVTIVSPASSTYTTDTPTVVVSGTASDDAGITQVLWASDRGPSGAALGTTAWTTPTIRLELGTNVIRVTARDSSGNTTTATLAVVYRDSIAPAVTIGTPTSGRSFTTASPTVSLSGTASDNFGVAQVSWANDRGGSGIAFGTTGWAVAAVPLAVGVNTITVSARDAAGLVGTATLRVERTGAGPSSSLSATPAPSSQNSAAAAQSTTAAAGTPAMTNELVQTTALSMSFADVGVASDAGATMARSGASTPASAAPSRETPARPQAAGAQDVTANRPEQSGRAPAVAISAPSATDEHATQDATITLAGTARDAVAVVWTTSQGASGTATGRDRWSVPNFAVPVGTTVVTVTARNAAGDTATDTITLRRRSTTALQLDITSPTADSAWHTTSSTVALRGAASDNVVRVTWQADWGGNGTATGTGAWNIPTIGLQIGVNRITVTAHDAQGRTEQKVLTITYRVALAAAALGSR